MKRLRRFSQAVLLACASALPLAAGAAQAPSASLASPTIRLSADHVAFYYSRFLVEADGNVRVTIGGTTVITGQTFSMDLKANRLLVAGAVTIVSPTGTQTGAAVSDYLDFGRVYFIPILSEPDRWTFLDNDFANPAKGREMPGDAFALPDLSHATVYLRAKGAAIVPRHFINFHSAVIAILGHPALPAGPYYINFGSNRYLAENSLAGATYDATWQIAGSANTISAIHFRYDPENKAYASFEEHVASDRGYAVFSVNPATEDSKYYNLFTGYTITPTLEIHSFTQYHLQQFGLSQPLAGQDVSYAYVTKAFANSSVQLVVQQFNLCNISTYPDPDPNDGPGATYCGVGAFRTKDYTHPSQVTLGVNSSDRKIGKTPFTFNYNYGMGDIHDAYTLTTFGGTDYSTIWNHFVGGTVSLPNVRIGDRAAQARLVYLNASINALRTWYSLPHHLDTIDGKASLSRQFGRKVNGYLQYEVDQQSDIYNGGQQLVYQSYVPIVNGTAYPSYAAFQGLATFRTLSVAANINASPNVSLSLLARKHDDFPIAEPGEYAQPAPIAPFNFFYFNNTPGEPPYDVTADARIRITPTLAVDVERAYYFNFGNLRWSPGFYLQVSQ